MAPAWPSSTSSSPKTLVDASDYGLNTLANTVKVTLGPRGRNVLVERPWGAPLVTKDGVSVAKEIDLADKFQNMGVQVVKEVAEKTSDVAGDGTTTATLLTQVIYNEGTRLVAAGHNPIDLKRGVEAAVEKVVAAHQGASPSRSRTRSDIAHVATISANGETFIGDMLADAIDKVGTGRRHHRRGEPGDRDGPQRGRGHAVRPRATSRPTSSPTPRS